MADSVSGVEGTVVTNAPEAVAARHDLSPDLAARLSGINALTDAVVGGSPPRPKLQDAEGSGGVA